MRLTDTIYHELDRADKEFTVGYLYMSLCIIVFVGFMSYVIVNNIEPTIYTAVPVTILVAMIYMFADLVFGARDRKRLLMIMLRENYGR